MTSPHAVIDASDTLRGEAGGGDQIDALAFLLGMDRAEGARMLVAAVDHAIRRFKQTPVRTNEIDTIQLVTASVLTGIELGVAAERLRRAPGEDAT